MNDQQIQRSPEPAKSRLSTGRPWITGVAVAGGAVLGCFALALWNRKALLSMIGGLNKAKSDPLPEPIDVDAVY
jgi:hypothetical protein